MQIIYSDELVFFNKRFVFNKKWEYANFHLNSDGILTRLKGEKVKDWIDFKHVNLTVGKKTAALKDRPPLHHWIDENLLLCISDKRSNSKKNWWIVFPDFDHLKKWLTNADLIIKAYEAKRAALMVSAENKSEKQVEQPQTEDDEPSEIRQRSPKEKDRITEGEKERQKERDRNRERKYSRVIEPKPQDEIIHIYDDSSKYKKEEFNLKEAPSAPSYLGSRSSESISRTFPRRVLKEHDLNYVNGSSDRLNYEPSPEIMKRSMPPHEFQPIQEPPPPPPPPQPATIGPMGPRYPPPYEINYIRHENPHVTYIKHEKPPVTRVEYKSYDEFEEANRKYKEYEQQRYDYERTKRHNSRRSSSRYKDEPPSDLNQSTISEPKSSLRDTSLDKSRVDKNGTIKRNKIQFNDQVEVRN